MIEINLLPWREKQQAEQKKRFSFFLMVTGLTIVFALVMVRIYLFFLCTVEMNRHQLLQHEIHLFERKIQEIHLIKEKKEKLMTMLSFVYQLESKKLLVAHLMDELIRVMPDGVRLTELKQQNDLVLLHGYEEIEGAIFQLVKNIEKNSWFHTLKFQEIKPVERKSQYPLKEFQLTFKFYLEKRNDKPA